MPGVYSLRDPRSPIAVLASWRLSYLKLHLLAFVCPAIVVVHLGLKDKQQRPTPGFRGRNRAVRGS